MHSSFMFCSLLSRLLSTLRERLAMLSFCVRVCRERAKSRQSNSSSFHCSVNRKWESRLAKSCKYRVLLSRACCQERMLRRKELLF